MLTPPNRKLSVITVTLNAVNGLARTIQSVQSQRRRDEIEFIVIDGLSVDGSLELLEKKGNDVDVLMSSKDRGVYDAMNKGIGQSMSDWIYFLNAGDTFLNEDSLSHILNAIDESDVLYSDVIVDNGSKTYTFKTSFDERKLNHQGFVYRKDLHTRYGLYPVIKGLTAADYFFFLQLDSLKVKKLDKPIAIFQLGGLSSTVSAVHQKYCLDFLAGKIGVLNLTTRLVVYPFYRALKNLLK